MNLKQFNEVTDAQLSRCRDVLAIKGGEYVFGEDRLEHFKNAASVQGTTPEQALWGMASKHIVSLAGMCKNGSDDKALWAEKITDSMNYLILLTALVEEGAEVSG